MTPDPFLDDEPSIAVDVREELCHLAWFPAACFYAALGLAVQFALSRYLRRTR